MCERKKINKEGQLYNAFITRISSHDIAELKIYNHWIQKHVSNEYNSFNTASLNKYTY